MKGKKMLNHKKKYLKVLVPVLVAAVAGIATIGALVRAAGASGQLSLTPSSGTYTNGQQFTVTLQESGSAISAAQAGISYSSNLHFNGLTPGTTFSANLSPTTQPAGEVELTFATFGTPVDGVNPVATLSFTAIASGPATLTFSDPCTSSTAADCSGLTSGGAVISTTTANASFTIQDASTGGTGGGGTTGGGTGGGTSGGSGTTSGGSGTKSSNTGSTTKSPGAVSVTTPTSTTPVTAPDQSQVQVSTPAAIQPASVQSDGVQKIQYYLNNKLVFTAKDVPFTYHLDTTHLLNGTYTLKTVSYYSSGRTSTSTQKLIISNKFSFTQFRLLVGHYAAYIITLLVIVIAGLALWLLRDSKWFKRLHLGGSGPSGLSGGDHGSVPPPIQQPPRVVTPSSTMGVDLAPEVVPIIVDGPAE